MVHHMQLHQLPQNNHQNLYTGGNTNNHQEQVTNRWDKKFHTIMFFFSESEVAIVSTGIGILWSQLFLPRLHPGESKKNKKGGKFKKILSHYKPSPVILEYVPALSDILDTINVNQALFCYFLGCRGHWCRNAEKSREAWVGKKTWVKLTISNQPFSKKIWTKLLVFLC